MGLEELDLAIDLSTLVTSQLALGMPPFKSAQSAKWLNLDLLGGSFIFGFLHLEVNAVDVLNEAILDVGAVAAIVADELISFLCSWFHIYRRTRSTKMAEQQHLAAVSSV